VTPPDAGGGPPADGPLDEADLEILADIRDLFQAADPMPADLPERIRFSLALRDLEIEVARLAAEEDQQLLAVRGPEQSRTITFDSDSLTIMIRIDQNRDGTARVDGWLAPPQRREIELKTTGGALDAASDEQGRFAFASVPRGTAQLVVRPAEQGPSGSGRSVVTPALIL
jgi:predicted secreted protein